MSAALVAVLAGGEGRRMGATPKPQATLHGRPLVAWPLAAARAAGLEAVVVAKAGTRLPALDVPVWVEPDAPVHPLLGIVTALERAGRDVVAAGCDQPWLPPALLSTLAAGDGAAAPSAADGTLLPLPARWPHAALAELEAALAAERGLWRALAALRPRRVAVADATLLDGVDTPAALAAARARPRPDSLHAR